VLDPEIAQICLGAVGQESLRRTCKRSHKFQRQNRSRVFCVTGFKRGIAPTGRCAGLGSPPLCLQ
jgi:hypothetical protein